MQHCTLHRHDTNSVLINIDCLSDSECKFFNAIDHDNERSITKAHMPKHDIFV